jgi:disulfide bond formation protein DsbB
MRRDLFYRVLALAVLALTAGPVGIGVFVLGIVHGDSPCVLCWAQRTGMLLIGLMGLFVLRFGPRPKYLGLSILIAGWGTYMGVRHSSLHLVRDVGQGFSIAIVGVHTYVWSMFIYWVCVLAMGGLLLLLRDGDATRDPRRPTLLDRIATWVFLVVVAGNIVQAFASTGPPPYMGQSDPIRFSFNPAHWVWSTEEWEPAPISLRGRWAIEPPSLDGLAGDPAGSPLTGVATLAVGRTVAATLPLEGRVTDLAYHAASGRFAVTTERGVHLVDGGLASLQRRTVLDPGFSVDLGEIAGVAFLDAQTVLAVTQNKSYVVLKENGQADPLTNYRFFLDGFTDFDHLARSRFATLRARTMYVMSAAYSPERQSVYTISVPNRRTRQLVVSRFDRRDMTLSEEFVPDIDAASGLRLASAERGLREFYVTGAAIEGHRLYALSAAFGTLLTIDLDRRVIVAAHAIAGLGSPTGLAIKGDEFLIVDATGRVSVATRPSQP